MDQLVKYNNNIDWGIVKLFILLAVLLVMMALFKRDPSDAQKAMKVGVGLFIVAIILNIIGLTMISDNFTVFAFIIIGIALVRLFWSDTKKLSKEK